MIYVFDTSSISVFENYYPNRFPSFWSNLSDLPEGMMISCQEVKRELEGKYKDGFLAEWVTANKNIYLKPCSEEMVNIGRIFQFNKFRELISSKALMQGRPVADPFVVASAMYRNGTVVTEESYKPQAARIPNVCEKFNIPCIDLEGFMDELGWQF